MAKPKIKVNAIAFMDDFRSGKSRATLMEKYGLNDKSLEKLFRKLVDKGFLNQTELLDFESASAKSPDEEASQHREEIPDDRDEYTQPPSADMCPQCGAPVTRRALTCPECGHVLPGQERWEEVEPKKSFLDRVPPWVFGSIIAVPVVIAMFYVFRDIILPMTEAGIEQRRGKTGIHSVKVKKPSKARAARSRSTKTQDSETDLESLIATDILAEVDREGAVLTAGSRWSELSKAEMVRLLKDIRRTLIKEGLDPPYEVVDLWGRKLATVSEQSVAIHDQVDPKGPAEAKPTQPPVQKSGRTNNRESPLKRGTKVRPPDRALPVQK